MLHIPEILAQPSCRMPLIRAETYNECLKIIRKHYPELELALIAYNNAYKLYHKEITNLCLKIRVLPFLCFRSVFNNVIDPTIPKKNGLAVVLLQYLEQLLQRQIMEEFVQFMPYYLCYYQEIYSIMREIQRMACQAENYAAKQALLNFYNYLLVEFQWHDSVISAVKQNRIADLATLIRRFIAGFYGMADLINLHAPDNTQLLLDKIEQGGLPIRINKLLCCLETGVYQTLVIALTVSPAHFLMIDASVQTDNVAALRRQLVPLGGILSRAVSLVQFTFKRSSSCAVPELPVAPYLIFPDYTRQVQQVRLVPSAITIISENPSPTCSESVCRSVASL